MAQAVEVSLEVPAGDHVDLGVLHGREGGLAVGIVDQRQLPEAVPRAQLRHDVRLFCQTEHVRVDKPFIGLVRKCHLDEVAPSAVTTALSDLPHPDGVVALPRLQLHLVPDLKGAHVEEVAPRGRSATRRRGPAVAARRGGGGVAPLSESRQHVVRPLGHGLGPAGRRNPNGLGVVQVGLVLVRALSAAQALHEVLLALQSLRHGELRHRGLRGLLPLEVLGLDNRVELARLHHEELLAQRAALRHNSALRDEGWHGCGSDALHHLVADVMQGAKVHVVLQGCEQECLLLWSLLGPTQHLRRWLPFSGHGVNVQRRPLGEEELVLEPRLFKDLPGHGECHQQLWAL
mmetsp:Transcript_62666/g.149536  ORF Transcript_62666/g.149536 Transcript_62666/m.149536 type:complete len:346 (+) Transcript_62666:1632-2669(+)